MNLALVGTVCMAVPKWDGLSPEQQAMVIRVRAEHDATGRQYQTCECGEPFNYWHELDCRGIAEWFVPAPSPDAYPRIVRVVGPVERPIHEPVQR